MVGWADFHQEKNQTQTSDSEDLINNKQCFQQNFTSYDADQISSEIRIWSHIWNRHQST